MSIQLPSAHYLLISINSRYTATCVDQYSAHIQANTLHKEQQIKIAVAISFYG
jgi:hypothetical protein